jgi:hypothetical protein
MPLKYVLEPKCAHGITDVAGEWIIAGGLVLDANKKQVGNFSTTRRTSCGTVALKTSQLWLTLFFTGKTPPENMTLHGAAELGTNDSIGSVSAASPTFAAQIGKAFTLAGNVLTIA